MRQLCTTATMAKMHKLALLTYIQIQAVFRSSPVMPVGLLFDDESLEAATESLGSLGVEMMA